MKKPWMFFGLAMMVVAASSVRVAAEEPPAGLSAPEWRQITSLIEIEQEQRDSEAGAKHTKSLYALHQKIGPEPTIPNGRFGYSVAIDGDVAVVGAAFTSLAFVFTREPEGWELRQTLEGFWSDNTGSTRFESRFFGYSVAIDGTTIVVGAPNYGLYHDDASDEVWGNAFVFEETVPGSWNRTASVIGLVPYQPPQYLTPFLDSWLGISVGISGDTVVAGAPGHSSLAGECVVVTRSGGEWEFDEFVSAAFPGAGDYFGRALSIFGDTLVVGAPYDQVMFSSEAGRAYVFDGSGATWTQVTELTADDYASEDHFGKSVSVVSSVVLVGAPDDDHSAEVNAGSAYVFTATGGVWSQSQKLVALDGEAGDRFGAGVALGSGVAIVGAPHDNHGMLHVDNGSAYVFKPFVGTWYQQEKIFAPDGKMSDHFGWSVAIWGSTAVVGSPYDDAGNVTNAGSAHFFEDDSGVWSHDGMVLGVREGQGKTFGYSVAVDDEIMVVGIIDASLNDPVYGEAYIFGRAGGSWQLEWTFNWGDDVRYYGGAVAVSGDTVMVGAWDWGIVMGVAFVYRREVGILGPIWDLEQSLLASDGSMGDAFGFDVAIDGDTAVVGAPFRDMGGVIKCGGAYVYSRAGSVWSEDAILENSEPETGDQLGFSVDIEGEVVVAGAKWDDGGAEDAGAVFVFRRSAGVWSEEQKLIADNPQAGAVLGHDVSLAENTLVAGAPVTDVSGHPGAGAAHVFVEAAGVWSEEQQLTASVPDTDNYFGQAVGITGNTVVIGNPRWELHPYGAIGSAEVFYRSGSTWSMQQRLIADTPENGARFGLAIDATVDGIAVGAYNEDFTTAYPGVVYWFEGSIDETDLSIALDDGVTEVVPGTGISYMTVVTNAGPSEAMGATVSDTFPPELLNCSWTCDAFGGALCTPGPVAGDIADSVDLPVAGRLEYTTDCIVASSAAGTLSNTATVTAPPGVADTNPLNNAATDVDALTPEADLSIGKDNGVTQVVEGEPTTYTITVSNPGPSDAPASTVTDVFPVELADCSWTCMPGAGAACAAAGVGDINDVAGLPAGGGVTYLATCTLTASSGQCSNTAEVTPPAGVVDPNPLDNDATDTDPVVGIVDVVYVSRILEGEVAVIDVETNAVIRLLDTGTNPAEVGIVTGLSRAFVADLTDGTVTVIDTGDHSIEDVIDVGVPVATVGIDEAAQRVYALDFSNGVPGTDLHVVDADSLVELDTFTAGSRTQNIAVSAAADLAYITDFDDGVVEVDLATGATVRTLPIADLAHGVALDAAADRLYVTRIDGDSVAIIDTTTLTEIDVLAVGDVPQWIALDQPRSKAFVTNEGDGTVSVIDTATGTVNPVVIPVGPGPLTITIHDGAAKAYVYNTGDGTISVIDTVSETVIATLSPLFADGFESGSTSAWSAVGP